MHGARGKSISRTATVVQQLKQGNKFDHPSFIYLFSFEMHIAVKVSWLHGREPAMGPLDLLIASWVKTELQHEIKGFRFSSTVYTHLQKEGTFLSCIHINLEAPSQQTHCHIHECSKFQKKYRWATKAAPQSHFLKGMVQNKFLQHPL
jgi:hypothetical protein